MALNPGRTEAIEQLEHFLSLSPRPALEVQVLCHGEHWCWRHGTAALVEKPVFEIGSVGKVLTSTLLAKLARDGVLQLDDPVSRFLPALPFAAHVSLQQLASHGAGLPRNSVSEWQLRRQRQQLTATAREADLLTFLQGLSAAPRKGRRAVYSNVGMALLGRILGQVCGSSYAEAVRMHLLEPLGMRDTHTNPEAYSAGRVLPGHDARGRIVPNFCWPGMEGAGVWYSTGDDMMIWLKAQMGLLGEPWAALADVTTRPVAPMSRRVTVGLGWMLERQPAFPSTLAWHSGGTFGQHATVAWARDAAFAIVLLSNRVPPFWHHLWPPRQLESLPGRLYTALTR